MDDNISDGEASAAVAMANSAIDNARRAAATSRSRRMVAKVDAVMRSNQKQQAHPFDKPTTPSMNSALGSADYVRNDAANSNSSADVSFIGAQMGTSSATDLDMKRNDNTFHIIATLLTDRLLPKLSANSSFYTLSEADIEYFTRMLPRSVRIAFVDALRYRLQNPSTESPLKRLLLQCQILGLDNERNVLLELEEGHGMTYPVYNNGKGLEDLPSNNDYGTTSITNGVKFGLSSPMSTASHSNQLSSSLNDTNNDYAATDEYLENNIKMRTEADFRYQPQQFKQSYTRSDQRLKAQIGQVGTYKPNDNRAKEGLQVCDVVAPSDLPGGYIFEAQLSDRKFLATVPPEGVTKGQRFISTMRELKVIEIPVRSGAWKDETCDCLSHGVFHPLLLNAIFFPCVALGQIMTRTGLNWRGNPANKLVSGLSCVNMSVILIFWLTMNSIAAFIFRVKWERGMDIKNKYIAILVAFNVISWCLLINITRKVRKSIRNKYEIPEETCVGHEDCICAMLCTPCTICRMGRHTADFETYRGTCCSATGLQRKIGLAQVQCYESQYQNVDEHIKNVV